MALTNSPPRKGRFRRDLRRKGNNLEKDFRLGRVRVTIRDQYKRLKKRWRLSNKITENKGIDD